MSENNGTQPAVRQPAKPGLDPVVDRILTLFEFARDTGGELFLLPNTSLRAEPYVPRSFLTRDVLNLVHQVWRYMADDWNGWVGQMTEAERSAQGVKFSPKVPSDTTARTAASHLEALGMARGRMVSAALRSVQVPDGIVIDLGDNTGRVVYISQDGWKISDPRDLPFAPPVFRRSVGYLPIPEPERGGDLAELWKILHVSNPVTQALAGGWLMAAFFADVSRPGVWVTGPPGAGKTTLAGGLTRIIDGSEWLDGRLSKGDERDNIIRATKNYVVTFDNMSAVTADMSDWICQLVTGHRDTFRRMRTNFDDVSVAYKRTFAATGLDLPFGLGADALDRIIEIPCDQLSDGVRLSDEQLQLELDSARARLLGSLLDHVAGVLAKMTLIRPNSAGLARMNGYAQILICHDAAYDTGYLTAYLGSVRDSRKDKAEGEPVVAAMMRVIEVGGTWEGVAQGLYAALSPHRDFSPQAQAWWPADARALSSKLNALDGVLRSAGFTVLRKRTGDGRLLTITRQKAP